MQHAQAHTAETGFLERKLAKGKKIEEINKGMMGMVAEGVQTTKAVYDFSRENNLYMPLTEQAYNVIYKNKDLKEAISDLTKIE